ncbi:hypothetical protein [Blastococcus montanus]|uniref:hypothetical protein n=1 Tax=Blastococcus montanus TaxID=3144973 RepID=UPI003207C19B
MPDGTAAVPVMDGSVLDIAAHLASCLAFYAHDLAAGPAEVSANDLVRRPGADLATHAAGIAAWGEVLARTLEGAGAGDRGWHSHGVADPAGFAAIGCAELLVHGDDVATALGLTWSPPVDVAAGVLARLFPDAPPAEDSLATLRWATGRADLPGRPRRTGWRYAMTPVVDR